MPFVVEGINHDASSEQMLLLTGCWLKISCENVMLLSSKVSKMMLASNWMLVKDVMPFLVSKVMSATKKC